MSYWNKVLEEILNKHDPFYFTAFTNVRECATFQDFSLCEVGKTNKNTFIHRGSAKKHTQIMQGNKKYYLGEKFPDAYLTRREAQIMLCFLHGMSTTKAARLFDLSRRTVEFYISNMKIKLNCQFKSDLINKIMDSDFLKCVDFTLESLSENNIK